MITLVTILHVLVCVFLIIVILLQAGKGGGMGAAFGGAGSQTVFGGRGATFLGRLTSVSAGIFMVTSLTLAYHASKTTSVVEREVQAPAGGTSPLAPPSNAPQSVPPTTVPGQAPAQPAAPTK